MYCLWCVMWKFSNKFRQTIAANLKFCHNVTAKVYGLQYFLFPCSQTRAFFESKKATGQLHGWTLHKGKVQGDSNDFRWKGAANGPKQTLPPSHSSIPNGLMKSRKPPQRPGRNGSCPMRLEISNLRNWHLTRSKELAKKHVSPYCGVGVVFLYDLWKKFWCGSLKFVCTRQTMSRTASTVLLGLWRKKVMEYINPQQTTIKVNFSSWMMTILVSATQKNMKSEVKFSQPFFYFNRNTYNLPRGNSSGEKHQPTLQIYSQ